MEANRDTVLHQDNAYQESEGTGLYQDMDGRFVSGHGCELVHRFVSGHVG